jgi:DNA ligase 1
MISAEGKMSPSTGSEKEMSAVQPKKSIGVGEEVQVKSDSSDAIYVLKFKGGVYSCTCVAWRQQSKPLNKRSCKHLLAHLGVAFEQQRCGSTLPLPPTTKNKSKKRKKNNNVIDDNDDDDDDDDDDDVPASKKSKKNQQESKKNDGEKTEDVKVLLAKKYEGQEVVGWWISEKLDGIRAYWDGPKGKLLTRNGNPIHAPPWFLKDFPKDVTFDGELYLKCNAFNETSSTVRSYDDTNEDWKQIRYMVFDIPSARSQPFEVRVQLIADHAKKLNLAHFLPVGQTLCTSAQQMDQLLKAVLAKGGEGLMLREPKSLYVGTRSSTLLKVKEMLDAEAIVIGRHPGKGRHQGVCGSLECRLHVVDGSNNDQNNAQNNDQNNDQNKKVTFHVGSGLSDEQRKHPPKKGQIISISYQSLTPAGKPRFPIFRGIAIDR